VVLLHTGLESHMSPILESVEASCGQGGGVGELGRRKLVGICPWALPAEGYDISRLVL
jgi:hypothetical protein